MRRQRSGHVITITSVAGIVGVDFCSAYATSKFALEGWMETLHTDVEPYGIRTTIVEPGFFRTELLVEGASAIWPELSIPDYAERTRQTIQGWKAMNGTQPGDPAKFAAALLTIAAEGSPPARWAAGADAVSALEEKAQTLLDQAAAHRDLSSSLAHEAQ
jgi:NAD(P)-dependent dehydrogenase (short-subunit alcohol dehydrogenase family)